MDPLQRLLGPAFATIEGLVPYLVVRELAGEALPAGAETWGANPETIQQTPNAVDSNGANLNQYKVPTALSTAYAAIMKYWLLIILALLVLWLIVRFV